MQWIRLFYGRDNRTYCITYIYQLQMLISFLLPKAATACIENGVVGRSITRSQDLCRERMAYSPLTAIRALTPLHPL